MKLKYTTVFVILIAGFLIQAFALFQESEARAVAIGYFVCLISIVILFVNRARLHDFFSHKQMLSKKCFIIVGVMGAVYVETIFLIAEKITHAQNVAVHPNLLIDLLVTMPWYIALVIVFGHVYYRFKYSLLTVLLLGGIYEICADGILGGILIGNPMNFKYIMLLLLQSGLFIIVYAPIVVLPVLIFEDKGKIPTGTKVQRLIGGVLPLCPLVPYGFITILLFGQ